ncbi:MAG: peptide MFS transporter [Candidatus Eremiobacteraeota bacterium]|nr:peptide MFS transporter [Candidatus Eremiobacteraeota bacterium]MCW5867573.1 peptide MFS transporter [Candidatus Eremiobacteraeota bacterium]
MSDKPQEATVLGHPAGLFTLFFAEMWERFSYYGMRALLVFYMIKGFLAYNDANAYKIYGAYTALVYATPFIGGMLADKLLGARVAVIIGGTLMALGHLLMGIQNQTAFFLALGLLITGNGFFKPNISTIVGSLYKQGNPKRDAGFTIFYMGINLGAAMSPLLCGYVGEKFGWHYGFNLATFGMLIGLAVFVAPNIVTQFMILGGAFGSAAALFYFQEGATALIINGFVAITLVLAALVAAVAIQRGGLPRDAGACPHPARLMNSLLATLGGVAVAVPVFAFLVQQSSVAGTGLIVFGGAAFLWLIYGAFQSHQVERERLFVVLILMFFSMLFWAFFEQAGSSVSNFTDRNVNRVSGGRVITQSEVGQTIELEMGQAQLGYQNGGQVITMTLLDEARKEKKTKVSWLVTAEHVGMVIEGKEMPASTFQAANAIFIVVLGLVFSALWGFLASRNLEPSTPVKFSLGLIQLGLGFVAFWYGAAHPDSRGMVFVGWLLLGYLLQTTGELCLSPVGLSMVTKLSPARMVSTVMGAWFLATAFSNYLAGMIASLTGVSGEGGKEATIPIPLETVGVYGGVFKIIAITAIGSGVFCLLISPILKKWMHTDVVDPIEPSDQGQPLEIGFSPSEGGQL